MKLIVTGASGYVGREVIRQSLSRREITSVVAVARSPVTAPEKLDADADASKLKSVVIEDYEHYSDEVKKEFADANACVWYGASSGPQPISAAAETVAITPSRSKAYEFSEVKRICQTSTVNGLNAMQEAGPAKPFRFLYVSGAAAERDQTKTPSFSPQYSLMRGETENQVLALAKKHGMEASVVKPGYITQPWDLTKIAMGCFVRVVAGIPSIYVADLAGVMLDQVVNGFDRDPLMPNDLAEIATRISKS
ncbi:NAD(P)-binding protein [Xylariaceae sp. FL1019]|nr:NAD(P)-binding protein [Xylariaceae sp. FL1019]